MFEGMFSEKITLRNSDFDFYGRIKPSSVLDVFQEAATRHAELLGVGFARSKEKNMLWVLTKVRYTVHKNVGIQTNVIMNTCAYKPERLEFRRDYSIKSEDGEVLVTGSSLWAVINAETRKLMRASDIYGENPLGTEYLYDGKILRIRDFDGEKLEKTQTAEYSDIDRNGHVNNRRYADFVQNVSDSKREIKSFQIDYHKEVMVGDTVEFFREENENTAHIKGVKDGTVLFICEEEY